MIIVYRKISGAETEVNRISNRDAVFVEEIMGANEIGVTVVVDAVLDIAEGDYIKHDGIIYTLNRDAQYTIGSDVTYSYDLIFEHPEYTLINKLLENKITGYTTFTLTGKLSDFVSLVVWCMNQIDSGWTIGSIIDTNFKTITIADINCREALKLFAKEFDAEYYFNGTGKSINFAEQVERTTDHVFEQGRDLGLYSISQQNVDKEDTVTRVYVRGGNQNVPIASADEEGYLKLPENYLENFSDHSKVVERKVKFEEEFPHFVGTAATVSGENNRVITCPDIDFNISDIAVGDTARINFLTGDLMGNSFEFAWSNANKQITLIYKEDEVALPDQDGVKPNIPSASKKAKVGDTFNFTGVIMPASYVNASITRLRSKGQKWLDFHSKKRVKFNIDIDHRWMRGKNDLRAGDVVVISIPQKDYSQVIRVTKIEKQLRSNAISATVSNYLEETWEKYYKDRIEDVKNTILAQQANTKRTLETIFKDGIVTESELKVIESVLDRLYMERGQMNAQYLVVQGNPDLVNKVPLTNAWSSYQAAYINVRDSIENAISDGKITEGEKDGVNSKLSLYATQLNSLVSALETARGDIEDHKNQSILDITQFNLDQLQNQVDGQVNNWFYPYAPTLANYPASEWTTNEIRDRHIGDTFTNTQAFVDNATTPNAGKSWRYVKNESTYSWTLIADSDAVKALLQASQAQATADGKSTTFLVQPSNYHLGDTWVLNADRTVNGTAYKQGEILTATQDSTTFVEAHWIKRVRYTDDTAVDNLQIGGRNLFSVNDFVADNKARGYSTIEVIQHEGNIAYRSTNIENNHNIPRYLQGKFEANTQYYLQFKINWESYTDSGAQYIFTIRYTDGTTSILFASTSHTYRALLTSANKTIDYITTTRQHSGDVVIYNIQLEKGNKPTDWTPAPKDVQAEISAAKQEALTAAGNAQTTANSLKDFTDTAFRDGIIDRSESVAIEKYKNSLNEAMSKAEASYNKVYANTYLEGAAKTALLNAKINLWGQSDTLLTAINTAIAGGTTTPAQKTAVDNAFGYFNSLMSAFQSALEEANKAIQAKLDALSTEKVNNIQIGGRNFFPLSRLSVFTTYATLKETGYDYLEVVKAAQENTVAVSPWAAYVAANLNKRIIVTGYFYINGEPVTDTYNNTLATAYRTTEYYEIDPSTGFIKCIMSPSPSVYSVIHAVFRRNGVPAKTGDVVRMEKVMVEVVESGRIHTDYVRPIEDIQKDINDAKIEAEQAQLEAEQAQLTANGYMRARYIRDWARGSSTNVNTSNWNEIRVVNKAGSNLAAGITPTTNGVFNAGSPASNITDGNISSQAFINNTSPTLNYVQIDLGQIHYDIDYIQVWHWWADGRTYYGTKTEISEDGVNWTTLFDSATEGTYPETEAGKVHTQRYEKVMAKLNQSLAVTDKIGTTTDGGLVTTVMMMLREYNSEQNTAGISGLQGALRDQPSYWSGGTHEQAQAFVPFIKKIENDQATTLSEYQNLPRIVFLHNGAGKLGDFIVDSTGRILMIDPDTGQIRLVFGTNNIPPIDDLIAGISPSGSATINGSSTSTNQVLAGSTNVTKSGASGIFNNTSLQIAASGRRQANGQPSAVYASIWLRVGGVRKQTIATVSATFDNTPDYTSKDITIETGNIPLVLHQTGVYSFELVVSKVGDIYYENASVNGTTFTWKYTMAGVKRFEYGLDGMMFFYGGRHFYYTEGAGLDLRGPTNMPGVLASGSVSSTGIQTNVWGAKSSSAGAGTITGGRSVPLSNLTHNNYTVIITPHTATTFRVGTKTTTSFQALGTGGFDYVVIGKNYQ